MIVSEGDIHHGPDDHVAFTRHWPFLDSMHTQDSALGRIHNGCGKQGSIDSAIADREGAPPKLLQCQLVLLRPAREVPNGNLNLGETESFGVAQDRHDQSLATANRNSDIIMM